MLDQLDKFPTEHSALADALTTADLTTGPRGESVSFEQRIQDIFERYKPESPVHRALLRSQRDLGAAVERTLVRLP